MKLSFLYRGPLASCNYACPYCPFAKRRESRASLAADRQALERFVGWVETHREHRISVLFTPWGEALIRRWYQDALVALTGMAHVEKAAIQTNLSCALDWAGRCDPAKLGIWSTYHPGQVSRRRFLSRCRTLDRLGIRYSVGVVGMKEHLAEAEAIRRELPARIYVWVNAYKHVAGYYTPEEIERLTAIDPLFPLSNTRHASRGHACRTGHSVLSVDGDGTLRRCHFVEEPLGNLYDLGDLESILRPAPCPRETCDCHIGHVHLERLGLDQVFGDGILERAPPTRPE